jgi:hypothetical protein
MLYSITNMLNQLAIEIMNERLINDETSNVRADCGRYYTDLNIKLSTL